jgi:hypothetical protein
MLDELLDSDDSDDEFEARSVPLSMLLGDDDDQDQDEEKADDDEDWDEYTVWMGSMMILHRREHCWR